MLGKVAEIGQGATVRAVVCGGAQTGTNSNRSNHTHVRLQCEHQRGHRWRRRKQENLCKGQELRDQRI